MQIKSFTGASLEQALKDDSLSQSGVTLIGMVKLSNKEGYICFTQSGCDSWVDIPVSIIEEAELIGRRACQGHFHAIMKITLKELKSPEGQILSALLAQLTQSDSNTTLSGYQDYDPKNFEYPYPDDTADVYSKTSASSAAIPLMATGEDFGFGLPASSLRPPFCFPVYSCVQMGWCRLNDGRYVRCCKKYGYTLRCFNSTEVSPV